MDTCIPVSDLVRIIRSYNSTYITSLDSRLPLELIHDYVGPYPYSWVLHQISPWLSREHAFSIVPTYQTLYNKHPLSWSVVIAGTEGLDLCTKYTFIFDVESDRYGFFKYGICLKDARRTDVSHWVQCGEIFLSPLPHEKIQRVQVTFRVHLQYHVNKHINSTILPKFTDTDIWVPYCHLDTHIRVCIRA